MSWLYAHVVQEQDSRAPYFSEQSALNWMRALSFEITRQNGANFRKQFEACRSAVRGQPKPALPPLGVGAVFEPLFGAVTNAMSLARLAADPAPFHRPASVVTWYYAIYNSVRAMFAAMGQPVGENHTAAMNAFASNLRMRLPHPFNIHARHARNEDYATMLPSYPGVPSCNVSSTFDPSAGTAQGMLLEYLSGTARWYVERTKEKLRTQRGITNFRKRSDRELRNKWLQKDIAFLHCAFRYRTKANYRDAIYLAYGARELHVARAFAEDLAIVAQFMALSAFAFCEWLVGPDHLDNFTADLDENIRGINDTRPSEAFWRAIRTRGTT